MWLFINVVLIFLEKIWLNHCILIKPICQHLWENEIPNHDVNWELIWRKPPYGTKEDAFHTLYQKTKQNKQNKTKQNKKQKKTYRI